MHVMRSRERSSVGLVIALLSTCFLHQYLTFSRQVWQSENNLFHGAALQCSINGNSIWNCNRDDRGEINKVWQSEQFHQIKRLFFAWRRLSNFNIVNLLYLAPMSSKCDRLRSFGRYYLLSSSRHRWPPRNSLDRRDASEREEVVRHNNKLSCRMKRDSHRTI